MKLTLALLLFASVARGQGWNEIDSTWRAIKFRKYIENAKPQDRLNIFSEAKPHWVLLDSLLSWYDSYKRECWADSTGHDRVSSDDPYNHLMDSATADSVYYTFYRIDDNGNLGHAYKAVRYRYYWTPWHRDPTFPGFIEFLRKRVK